VQRTAGETRARFGAEPPADPSLVTCPRDGQRSPLLHGRAAMAGGVGSLHHVRNRLTIPPRAVTPPRHLTGGGEAGLVALWPTANGEERGAGGTGRRAASLLQRQQMCLKLAHTIASLMVIPPAHAQA
jgi:hypothetical protein